MDLGLRGKTVLVTGSTAGIGFASARRFALEGASVVINGRSAQRVDASVEAIGREVDRALVRGVVADVSSAGGVRLSRHYLAGMLARNWGRIVFVSSESALQIRSR